MSQLVQLSEVKVFFRRWLKQLLIQMTFSQIWVIRFYEKKLGLFVHDSHEYLLCENPHGNLKFLQKNESLFFEKWWVGLLTYVRIEKWRVKNRFWVNDSAFCVLNHKTFASRTASFCFDKIKKLFRDFFSIQLDCAFDTLFTFNICFISFFRTNILTFSL